MTISAVRDMRLKKFSTHQYTQQIQFRFNKSSHSTHTGLETHSTDKLVRSMTCISVICTTALSSVMTSNIAQQRKPHVPKCNERPPMMRTARGESSPGHKHRGFDTSHEQHEKRLAYLLG